MSNIPYYVPKAESGHKFVWKNNGWTGTRWTN